MRVLYDQMKNIFRMAPKMNIQNES